MPDGSEPEHLSSGWFHEEVARIRAAILGLVILFAASLVAAPRAAPTNVAGLHPAGRVEASSDLRWGQLGAPHPANLTAGYTLGMVSEPATGQVPGGAPSSAANARPHKPTFASGFARAVPPVRSASMPTPSSALISVPTSEPYPSGDAAPLNSGAIGTALIGGWATWHDACRRCAAAGPDLRAMLGPDWRGTAIEVHGPGFASVTVSLTDACACGERHGLRTLLDLSADAFAELAPLDWGIVAVSIEIPAPATQH